MKKTSFLVIAFLFLQIVAKAQTITINIYERIRKEYSVPGFAGVINGELWGDCMIFSKADGQYIRQNDSFYGGYRVCLQQGSVTFEKPSYGFVGKGSGNIFYYPYDNPSKGQKIKVDMNAGSSGSGKFSKERYGFVQSALIENFFVYNNGSNFYCLSESGEVKWTKDLSSFGLLLEYRILEDHQLYILAENETAFTLICIDPQTGGMKKTEEKKPGFKINGAHLSLSKDKSTLLVGCMYGKNHYEFWNNGDNFRSDGMIICRLSPTDLSVQQSMVLGFPEEYSSEMGGSEKGILNPFVADMMQKGDNIYVISSSYTVKSSQDSYVWVSGPVLLWTISGTEVIASQFIQPGKGSSMLGNVKLYESHDKVWLAYADIFTPENGRQNYSSLSVMEVTGEDAEIKTWHEDSEKHKLSSINVAGGAQLDNGDLIFLASLTNSVSDIASIRVKLD